MYLINRRRLVTSAVTVVFTAGALLAQSSSENTADTERLVKALDIRAGSTVGEIGAGGGDLSIAIARAVGESGRVFANELNRDRLKTLAAAAKKAGLKQVTAVEGRENETNLPDGCCDAVFMRNVYHHFGDPAAMDASLFRSLKPGGRLAIIDFSPAGDESPTPAGRSDGNRHGVKAQTVERELKAAGFEILSSGPLERQRFMVVAQRPAGLL